MDKVNGYGCQCGARYKGLNCEKYLGSLCEEKNLCLNNGLCTLIDNKNDYLCTCPEGLTGRNCETKFLPCDQNPCENNSTCSNDNSTASGYKCHCPPGINYLSIQCMFNIFEC